MPRLAEATRDQVQSQTRERLLEAAANEFAEKGFAAANINTISREAGYAKGTIYNYFNSKRDLMLALLDEIGALHTTYIVSRIQEGGDLTQRMTHFFEAGFDFVHKHFKQAQIAISVVFGHDSEFKERIFDAYIPLFEAIMENILEFGVKEGELRSIDLNQTTALIMSLYLGGCSLADPEGVVWGDQTAMVSFVLDGLRVRKA